MKKIYNLWILALILIGAGACTSEVDDVSTNRPPTASTSPSPSIRKYCVLPVTDGC